jgi:DegV family protein with EDD domain
MPDNLRKTVAIVTDSAACVPPALAQEYGIQVVPYQLVWDGQVYWDGQDLTPSEFYRRFRTSSTYPTTATPTMGQFIAAYRRAAEQAQAIVAIFVAETLTSTIRLARQAAQEVDIPVRIVDPHTAATPEGFIVLAAARAAQQGASPDEVVALAESYRGRVGMFFAMETLEHLHRGGRIGQAATLLGARLRIQPVLTLADGQVKPVTIMRSRQRALERLVEETAKVVGTRPIRASVFHADVAEEAQQLAERVQRAFRCIEFFISEFTPVMGAHTGPGIIGIGYCLEDEA